ncbi:MAG: hypothetical protein D3923_14380 [Candidatus Electrothrix sp. AR3]|nr:hypothetical protein [Candidatus Electrothrix sp. AR3]
MGDSSNGAVYNSGVQPSRNTGRGLLNREKIWGLQFLLGVVKIRNITPYTGQPQEPAPTACTQKGELIFC